ncbi:MAG TPA: ATP-binding protein [Candidatus Dormibacteraeota bacterium]|nr:ATP-binding protein [Candidatus Dormibacteraeota bacterium]
MSAARALAAPAAYMNALEARDVAAALAAVAAGRASGMSLTQVATELIGPAQMAVGARWQEAAWSVADEHAASSISEAVVHLIGASLLSEASDRPPLVLACAENEWHTLPALLAALALRDQGWRVLYLGASMPADHLPAFLTANRPLALAISCSLPLNLPSIRRQVAQAHALGVPVIAGGRALGEGQSRAATLGVDAVAGAGSEADQVLLGWLATPPQLRALPADGRPQALATELLAAREALAEDAFDALRVNFPGISGYDARQRQRTLEDLAYTIDFLATSIDVGAESVLTDYLHWLEDLLSHRRVPAAVLGRSIEALLSALGQFPEARAALAAGAASTGVAGAPEAQPNAAPRAPLPRLKSSVTAANDHRRGDFEAVVPVIRAEWERRAALSSGSLAVAEALSEIDDPIDTATTFNRVAGQALGFSTTIVTVPAIGDAATLGSPADSFWTEHPAHLMGEVIACLVEGRPRGLTVARRQALALPIAVGAHSSAVLVALSGPQDAAAERAVALTGLAGVLRTALRVAHLEQDNRAKAAFLSVIGHEFRTPLNAVIGYAGLLKQDGESLGPKRMKHVERILGGGGRLLGLVENVLDLVELESGGATERDEPVLLRPLLEQLAKAAAPSTQGVSVSIRCAATLSTMTDRHHLERALANILANAVQFSPKDGKVRVSATSSRSGITLRIRDDGPGMDPGQVAQLGQPFLQLSRGFMRTHGGVGLGFATARGHLQTIGAEIAIRSVTGQGTEVSVLLGRVSRPVAA